MHAKCACVCMYVCVHVLSCVRAFMRTGLVLPPSSLIPEAVCQCEHGLETQSGLHLQLLHLAHSFQTPSLHLHLPGLICTVSIWTARKRGA